MFYKNPIIKGFNPDPSICRVGNDYYLVTSTFEYFPGIPVYHSTDLVNWKMIGHVIERAEQLPMETAKSSGGIWAPTIRYCGGRFYVTATFGESGNFIVSSEEPAANYSNPVWTQMDGIDPSMFFENGKMYYCANDCGSRKNGGEGISLAEMNPETGEVIGDIKKIWNGTGGGWLEGPHIYHIGDYYYLLAAEGGSAFGHMSVLARSRELFGFYESYRGNPIMTNRNDGSKQALCCGHADLTDDEYGNLWIVHLGTRPAVGTQTNLGRETFLTPIVWKDGWFEAAGKMAKIMPNAEVEARQKARPPFASDFSAEKWENEFLFVKMRNEKNYERGRGVLTLLPSDRLDNPNGQPTFAAIRQPDFECIVTAGMEFEPKEVGDEAGIAVYLTPDFMCRICKRREKDGDYICLIRKAGDMLMTAYREKTTQTRLRFTIKASKEKYEFYCGSKEKLLASASTKLMTCETAPRCFTGTVIGMYAQSEGKSESKAIFDSFEAMEKSTK